MLQIYSSFLYKVLLWIPAFERKPPQQLSVKNISKITSVSTHNDPQAFNTGNQRFISFCHSNSISCSRRLLWWSFMDDAEEFNVLMNVLILTPTQLSWTRYIHLRRQEIYVLISEEKCNRILLWLFLKKKRFANRKRKIYLFFFWIIDNLFPTPLANSFFVLSENITNLFLLVFSHSTVYTHGGHRNSFYSLPFLKHHFCDLSLILYFLMSKILWPKLQFIT